MTAPMNPNARKSVCIHGHFYQPPRENAWLEAVEMQESAYPNHDWNERITRECYNTNTRARLLNDAGDIETAVSNYAQISYNFGPTLLAWMKDAEPETYQRIIDSDKESAQRFGGHGSAMAQGYNHTILPLCNDRDRDTQVKWGVRDFESRFNRKPAGMWMPETAVNTATLESLAAHGIAFTILAPRQCDSVRPLDNGEWNHVGEGVDPTQAYRCNLPSGRSITLFFYDGPVSQGVAFEGLLNSGERFADRILSGFDDNRPHNQLMHIATDGESYGHHHRHGEMALAAALHHIHNNPDIALTNYAQFLEHNPPTMEARIREDSSWSCLHGIERWRSDCGCNSGRDGWHQKWRAPLRAAFDWLRDTVNPAFESTASKLLKDPWAARDGYIEVILDRSPDSIDAFLARHARADLSAADRGTILRLMELQRHAMLMYTSCAWFFDDVGGIETVQVIQYAARVIQLARLSLGLELEEEFLARLADCPGNTREMPDGRSVYETAVRPAMLSLDRVAAHCAVQRLFEGPADEVYSFDVLDRIDQRLTSGRASLVVGHATFRSSIDAESAHLTYCAVRTTDHTVSCGVRPHGGDDTFNAVKSRAVESFDRADFAGILRLIDQEFGGARYSIASLFRDEQHRIVREMLRPSLAQIDASYQQIYDQHAPMARFLRSLSLTVPRRIRMIGSFVLSQSIRQILESPAPDLDRAAELAEEAAREGIELDKDTTTIALARAMRTATAAIPQSEVDRIDRARTLDALVAFTERLPFPADLWPLQEFYLDHLRPSLTKADNTDHPDANDATDIIRTLGARLRVRA